MHKILGANEDDLFVYSENPTDLALLSAFIGTARKTGRNHFLTLEDNDLQDFGAVVKRLPLNGSGQVSLDALQDAISPRTCMLSLSWANGITGVIQPIADIARFCLEKEILLHVDATHIMGKIYFRFQDYPINYLTFSGGLLAKEKTFVRKIQTNPHPLLKETLLESIDNFEHLCTETARLRDLFEKLTEGNVLFEKVDRLPNISVVEFDGAHPDALLFLLKKKGLDAQIYNSALSFTFTHKTTQIEIEKMAEIILGCVKKLRTYSYAL